MKYQCEVCGKSYVLPASAKECELSHRQYHCGIAGHDWWYYTDQHNDEVCRRCHDCAKEETVELTQEDLADLWARKTKESAT